LANFKYQTSSEKCGSSDALAVYDDDSVYCWSCGYATLSEEMKGQYRKNKVKYILNTKNVNKGEVQHMSQEAGTKLTKDLKPLIDAETALEVKSKTKTKGSLYRGIKDEVLVYFGVRTEYDDEGQVAGIYYPMTYDYELSGYKIRKHPKTFSSIGRTGAECELFGECRFKTGGRTWLLVGGEHEQLEAYQMPREYQLSRGKEHYELTGVV